MPSITFYPDPDVESTCVDGVAYYFSTEQPWATTRTIGGSGANDTGGSDNLVSYRAGTTSGSWDFIVKGFFLFDTSRLGNSAVITAAILSPYVISKGNGNGMSAADCTIDVVSSNPASNTALVGSSFQTLGTTRYSNSSITCINATTGAYNDFTLNATGLAAINRTGISKFGFKIAADIDGTTPAWVSAQTTSVSCYYADDSGATRDPKLVVTFNAPTITGLATLTGGSTITF